jgi:putative sterol carrier protein
MAKYLSDEYFAELQATLAADAQWNESTKGVKTSLLFNVTDTGQSYMLSVENGTTSLQKSQAGAAAEFTIEGTYENWVKVAKGEVDIQSAILKGMLRFKGSITKILFYRDRFMRMAELMRQVPKEF